MTVREAPLVLFVVTEDWYFMSHRAQLVPFLQRAGFRVALAARFGEQREALDRLGVECWPIALRRKSRSPWREWRAMRELRDLYREHRPAIVHHVALKPTVIGGLAARGWASPPTISAIAGMGLLVSWKNWRGAAIRRVAIAALRRAVNRPGSWIIAQNPDDVAALADARIGVPGQVVLIRGAGVDLREFTARDEPDGPVVVLYAGRMLRDKGVGRIVDAARVLRARGVTAHVRLVGEPDIDNPRTISAQQLQAWHDEGIVEWQRRRDDMPAVFAECHVLCLPTTYGEGVPKVLLEAAACGRPIVATDWPGCRDAVQDGVTGRLVAAGDSDALVDALATLIGDAALRRRMGAAGRELAEREFGLDRIAEQTIAVYRRALASSE